MQHKTLKLSTLAILIAGATHANAAVYRVVEVNAADASKEVANNQYFPEVTRDLQDNIRLYGQGVFSSSSTTSCFTEECSDTDYQVFGESRFGSDGINYRDEVAFITDNYQEVNDVYDLERYCDRNIGPNTCENWAFTQYYGEYYNDKKREDRTGLGGLVRELEAWTNNYYSNATGMVEQSNVMTTVSSFADEENSYAELAGVLGTIVDSAGQHKSTNSVVNDIGEAALGEYQLGITSGAYFDNGSRYARQFNKRGFVNLAGATYGLKPMVGYNNEQREGQDSLNTDEMVKNAGQTLAWDAVEYNGDLFVVGSASFNPSKLQDRDKSPDDDIDSDPRYDGRIFEECLTLYSDDPTRFYNTKECQVTVFANEAVFWTVGANEQLEAQPLAERVDGQSNEYSALDPDGNGDRSFQASARAVTLIDGKPVIAGFTTDSIDKESINNHDKDFYAVRAAVYEPNFNVGDAAEENQWTRKIIPGLSIEDGSGDRKLNYSIATDINQNNMVVGVAKNYFAENRSYAERMFIFNNNSNNLKFLDNAIDSEIFFAGSNGFLSAINNSDQVVGRIDSESVNQVDGRFRRQRAFTYIAGSDIAGSPLKANKAWMLDDLINDGDANGVSNSFRISEATGITDDGVISATAFKCEGGYDDLTNESFCAGGTSGAEKQVAVKLIPIPDGEIQARPAAETTIERSGASLGIFAMTMLGWLGFRRRK
ncbi:DUF3466 family protein [Photobacterium minamisatsumaniensis]|uniref:DUF3466 family protein n=1 Tax=Photobacterium minamisatsumaniensis TaxID=2910233 RepID=UPI003D0A5D95